MYYNLKKEYSLKGWKKFSAVLMKYNYIIRVLDKDEFNLLMFCDGQTDFAEIEDLLSENQKNFLKEIFEKGIIEKTNYPNPIAENQLYKYYNNRFVSSFLWSITGRCNYHCRHCYMDAPDAALGELSHEEAMDLVDQIADCGGLKIDITGGEPFVRKDFWDIVDYINSKGIIIGQIYTNGYLLNEKTLDEFEKRHMRPMFSLSFDGLKWHDWMRRFDGAEEAAIKALKLCKERKFPTNVEMCLHKGNVKTLPETINFLGQLLTDGIKIGSVSASELWLKNGEGMDMSMKEYTEAAIEYIPQFFKDGMPADLLIGGIIDLRQGKKEFEIIPERFGSKKHALNCHLCGAIRNSCYITPEGRIAPCLPMTEYKDQTIFPKFQEKGLKNILDDSDYMNFVDKRIKDLIAENKECAECPYVLKCGGGCRASALNKTGNLMGKDPDQCFLFKNGYVDKIRKTAEDAVKKYCK